MKTAHIVLPFVVMLLACGPGSGQGAGAEAPSGAFDPAQTAHTKCSACHAPPEAGKHSSAELSAIFQKHKAEKRVNLTDDQWTQMIDYLAVKK